ncbi:MULTISPECIES: DUF1501 domain-containing protein [unclassified Moraxella]|uniref:DUF1501 domain-containing protein n=1 Tax=unclassified Moraxella TaxID=2685852 RepID=UPI003AF4BE5C
MTMTTMNRRGFLARVGAVAGMGASQSFALNLLAMNQAVASDIPDYKALVGVFLLGGNDHANTLVPIDTTNYPIYQKHRGNIALDRASVLPLSPKQPLANGVQYGLHPNLKRLQALFNQQKLAVLQNVGTLIMPTNKQLYQTQAYNLPPKLFSHNDQQAFWQTNAQEGKGHGWGATLGQLTMSQNKSPLFTCLNTSPNGKMGLLAGNQVSQFNLSEDGAITMYGFEKADNDNWLFHSNQVPKLVKQMMATPRQNVFEQQISQTFGNSLYAQATLRQAFTQANITTPFADTSLAKQLKSVANMIKSNSLLGNQRQVFIVTLGGFDCHDNLLTKHGELMAELDEALASFYQATVEMGLANQVTTFTMSDFGRTFANNGDGTDHGWGGHHFIMGGAVKGQMIYGQTPEYGVDTASDVGQGRLIPTTSTDQYASTLARWFGVADKDMPMVATNIHNFSQRYLDFMVN